MTALATLYPSARDAVFTLTDGVEFDGETVAAYYQLQVDFADRLPAALIYVTGGTEGYIDRVDRLTVEVYAPGEQALKIAEDIRAAIVDEPLDIPGVGYIDDIHCDVTPHDVPYQNERINMAAATYLVTSRPL